jgi:hypothetical protein
MRRSVLMVAATFLVAGTSSGLAGEIKKHEKKEERRIERGEKSGKLTPKEAQRLENQQDVIEKEREQALEDGHVSKRERKDIRHDQKRLSQDIYKKKHNEKEMR